MQAEDVANQFGAMEIWYNMGWIAKGVVIVLMLMSIWSLGIAVERFIRFQKAKKESLRVAVGVTPLLKQHKLAEAITFTKDKRFRHSHLARVLAAGLTEFQYEATQELPADFELSPIGLADVPQLVADLHAALVYNFSSHEAFIRTSIGLGILHQGRFVLQ